MPHPPRRQATSAWLGRRPLARGYGGFAVQHQVSAPRSRPRTHTGKAPPKRRTRRGRGGRLCGPRLRPRPAGRGISDRWAPPSAPPRPGARPARLLGRGEPARSAPRRAPAAGLQGWARAPRPGQEDGGERAGAEAGAALQAGDRHGAGHPAAAGPGGVELQRPGGGRAGRGAPTAGRASGQAGRGGARGPGGAAGSPGRGSGARAACVPARAAAGSWASEPWRPFPRRAPGTVSGGGA